MSEKVYKDQYVRATLLRHWDEIRLPILRELKLRKSDYIISCSDLGYGKDHFMATNPDYFQRPVKRLGDSSKVESSGRRLI